MFVCEPGTAGARVYQDTFEMLSDEKPVLKPGTVLLGPSSDDVVCCSYCVS